LRICTEIRGNYKVSSAMEYSAIEAGLEMGITWIGLPPVVGRSTSEVFRVLMLRYKFPLLVLLLLLKDV